MRLPLLLALLSPLIGCGGRAVVRVDGSAGVIPLVAGLARAYAETGTGDSIALGGGLGSRARLDSLASGAIDIALASHGLEPDDLSARGLVVREIAQGAVVFGTHGGVILAGLSEGQTRSPDRAPPAPRLRSGRGSGAGAGGLLEDTDSR